VIKNCCIYRVSALVFAVFSISSAQAIDAANSTPSSIKALIDDIDRGQHQQAIRRISKVGQMTIGSPTIASTGRELVEVLAGCRLITSEPYEAAILRWEKSQWRCKSGVYEVVFGPEKGEGNPYVQVVDLLNPAALAQKNKRLAKLARMPAPVKTVPIPASKRLSAAEQADRLNQEAPLRDSFGKAVRDGRLDAISDDIASNATFKLGSSDPIFNTYLVDMSGHGMTSGNVQIAEIKQKFGQIEKTECGASDRFSFCEWRFKDSDAALLADIRIYDGKIVGADFYYLTRERTAELRELTEKLSNNG
jgi:hypothetical protein